MSFFASAYCSAVPLKKMPPDCASISGPPAVELGNFFERIAARSFGSLELIGITFDTPSPAGPVGFPPVSTFETLP